MNRSVAYDILVKLLNNYKVVVNKRPYNKLYLPKGWDWSYIKTDTVFIKGFNHVYLCTDELVIRDKYDLCQINIKYKDIKTLEVGGGNEEDIYSSKGE